MGKYVSGSSSGFHGLDYLLHIVLEERDLQSVTWQWVMGRLVMLELLLTSLPTEFSLETANAHTNFSRLMSIIDFSFQNLTSSHANVSKLAKRVFTLSARNTAADTKTFSQVWELLGALDNTLQMRMRKNITAAIEEMYLGEKQTSSPSSNNSSITEVRSPQEEDRSMFLERFLNECSNQHSEQVLGKSFSSSGGGKRRGWRPPLLRSTSHSPSRQIPSRSNSQSPSRAFSKPGGIGGKAQLCQSVYSINTPVPARRPSYTPSTKPRALQTRLAQKSKVQDTEVLPGKFDLSSLDSEEGMELDDIDLIKSLRQQRRTTSPVKHLQQREPAPRSPASRPRGGVVRAGSCKDLVDEEEHLALAVALSRSSVVVESPLPHIPGLSANNNQSHVIAHPHKQVNIHPPPS